MTTASQAQKALSNLPKTFPFPFGVGVDVCQVHRVAAILRLEPDRNRFVRRTYSRLEWPSLINLFLRANALGVDPPLPSFREWIQQLPDSDQIWSLPQLDNIEPILRDRDQYDFNVTRERSRLGVLMRVLAGRWAAKEAIIKAHRHRKLHMHEISVIPPLYESSQYFNSTKPVALIDPVCDTIIMSEDVATLRQLKRFGHRYQKSVVSGTVDGIKTTRRLDEYVTEDVGGARQTTRRSRVKPTDRQVAELSISHDGPYAVAVCMALDTEISRTPDRIVDDGTGEPKHEPEWGDEGWLDADDYVPQVPPNDNLPGDM